MQTDWGGRGDNLGAGGGHQPGAPSCGLAVPARTQNTLFDEKKLLAPGGPGIRVCFARHRHPPLRGARDRGTGAKKNPLNFIGGPPPKKKGGGEYSTGGLPAGPRAKKQNPLAGPGAIFCREHPGGYWRGEPSPTLNHFYGGSPWGGSGSRFLASE